MIGKVALLSAALLLLPSWTPSASAGSGTVKIDSDVDLSGSNNPHQGCGIAVEFYGFDPVGSTINAYVVVSGQGGAGAGTIAATSPSSGAANPFSFTAGTGTSTVPDFAKFYEIDTTGLTPKTGSTTSFQVDIDVYDAATNQPLSKQKIITVETCNADLAVDKRGPANYLQLGTGTYTIDVTNTGPNRSGSPITVVDTLPAGETATSASGTGWVCVISSGGSLVTCTRNSDLARLETAPRITVGVTYSATAITDLTDTATVDGPRLDLISSNNSDSVTTRPTPVLDVGIVKTATPASVAPGANITYDLVVTNTGTAPALSFSISDALGTGLTFVSATSLSAGLTCNAGAPASCSYSGSLAGNASVTARVVATVGAGFTGQSVTNAASVSMVGDTSSANNTDSVTTPVVHPRDLGVVKTVTAPAGGAAVSPGDTITYSLVVTNHGNGPVSSFTLTDTVPSTHNLTSVTPHDGRLTCSTAIVCTFAAAGTPLAPGASVSVTVVMTVDPSVTATSVSNTATVPADSNNANNSSTVTTNVNQPSDVKLVKTANPGTPGTPGSVKPGDSITYTLTASNDGVLPITGFTVSDDLDSSLTWVSTTPSGTGFSCLPGDPVQCTFSGTLAANAAVTATIVATVKTNFLGTAVPNVATATLTSAVDADNSNDSSSTSTPVTQPKDLELKKTATPATAMPGDSITYTLTAKNVGVLPITDFTLGDPLGTGLVWQSTSTAGGTALTCTNSAPVSCTFAGGNLTTGQSVVVTVVAKVDPAFTGSSVTNAALATMAGDVDTSNNSAAVSTGVTHPLDLAVVKTDSPDPVAPGDDITYAITVTNAGNGPVTSFTLTDTVPSTHTLKSVTPGAGLTCNTAIVCTFAGTLAPGASVAVQVVMTVKPTVTATSVSNTASVPADSNPRNDSSTATTAVTQPKDVKLVKTATPNPVKPGDTITYTLTASNDGILPITSFTITDTLNSDLTWVSTSTPAGNGVTCNTGGAVSCSFAGSLTTGQSVVVTVTAAVKASFTGTSTGNVGTATMAGDSDNSNDSSAVSTDVTQPKDLALTKTATPSAVSAGGNVTYTLTARNAAVLPITAFTLTDPLGAGLTWLSTSTTSPGLTCNTGVPVSCSFAGNLTSGQTVVVTVVANVPASFTGSSVSNAASSATPGDGNSGNDTATVTTPVVRPDLAITKTAPANAVSGTTGNYVLTVSNQGTGPAAGPVTVTDAVPAGATATGASGTGWTCTTSPAPVTCSLAGGLASGATAAPITVNVTWGAPGTVSNTATVAAGSGETDLSDNSSTAVTTVGPAPKADLALTKTGPASVKPGDTLTWTITVVNNGDGPASGVVVTDPLAAGLTLVSASGSGFTCTGTSVSCALAGTLAPAGTAVLTVVATLDAAFTGAAVANTAVASPTDATPADNSDTHVTDVAPLPVPAPADLVLTKDGPLDAVQPGDTIDWTIEVTNAGGTAATGFTVSDLIANGLTLTGASGLDFDCTGSPALACTYLGVLDPGESVTLVVTTTLDITYEADTATNTASVSPLDATDNNTDTAVVDVVFPITGGGGGPAVGPTAPPVDAAPLPATGADTVRALTLAMLLMVLGTLMIVTGRRRTIG